MLFCFAVVAESDAAKWPHPRPLADQGQSGAFGTGSWTDTSPRFGCCMATEVAIRELAGNAGPSNSSLTVARSHQPLVPVWEPVDFVGSQISPSRLYLQSELGSARCRHHEPSPSAPKSPKRSTQNLKRSQAIRRSVSGRARLC